MTDLTRKLAVAARDARWLVIDTPEKYRVAGMMLRTNKGLQKEVRETFKPIKDKIRDSLREAEAKEKKHLAPLVEAEGVIKERMTTYHDRIEREREEREQRLRADAVAQERARRASQAAALEAEGKRTEARRVLAAPVVAPPIVLPTETPKIDGAYYVDEWSFEIVDETMLPRDFMKPDETKIRKIVEAMKSNTNIPGVRVTCSKALRARAAPTGAVESHESDDGVPL